MGIEGFEIIEKSLEKFVKVGQKFGKVGCFSLKVGELLRKICSFLTSKYYSGLFLG